MIEGFEDVGAIDDLPEGAVAAVMAHGYRVAVFHVNGSCHALWARCPHAGGPLEDGYVKEGAVICPWHGSTFRVSSGERLAGPSSVDATVFPVEVVDGRVLIGPPPAGTEPPPALLF